jgi:hypothetical protein
LVSEGHVDQMLHVFCTQTEFTKYTRVKCKVGLCITSCKDYHITLCCELFSSTKECLQKKIYSNFSHQKSLLNFSYLGYIFCRMFSLRMIRNAFGFKKYIYLLQACTTVNKSSRLPVLAHNEAIFTSIHSLELTKMS